MNKYETYTNHNGDVRLKLTRGQIAHLQNFGLVAGPDEWHYHPSGSFALAPLGTGRFSRVNGYHRKDSKRQRVNLAPVTTIAEE